MVRSCPNVQGSYGDLFFTHVPPRGSRERISVPRVLCFLCHKRTTAGVDYSFVAVRDLGSPSSRRVCVFHYRTVFAYLCLPVLPTYEATEQPLLERHTYETSIFVQFESILSPVPSDGMKVFVARSRPRPCYNFAAYEADIVRDWNAEDPGQR